MLITFIGPDGAGKSTQTKIAHQWLLANGFDVVILDKWAILDINLHPECRFINSSLEDIRVCIAEMENESRALFLFWSIFQTMNKYNDLKSSKKIYISDGYWVKHAASEIIYGNNSEWINSIIKAFPKSDLTFYFNIEPEITALRKKTFTPYECGRFNNTNIDNFIVHQKKLKKILDTWNDKESWININADQSQNDISGSILEQLAQVLKNEKTI